MGLAAWLIGRERHANPAANTALILFAFQLILNALWSWIFFGRHEIGWAFIEIIALWGAILTTLFAFYRIRPLAGALLVPYLLWVGFAAILTGTIFVKN
jgi:tryptophan-rich sensory protein